MLPCISLPFELDQMLQGLWVEYINFFWVITNVHQRNFFVVFQDFPNLLIVQHIETNLIQQIDGILHFKDLELGVVLSLLTLFDLIEFFFWKYSFVMMSEMEKWSWIAS